MWADDKIVAMDFETSGTLPEYALQPWRLPKGDAWITSVSAIRKQDGKLVPHLSKLFPTVADLRSLLEEAIANKWILLGWNVTFDISWLFALGLGDLVMQLKWLDGMLLYRHLEIEPEYDITRPNKRSYGLKAAVAQYIPAMAGYEEEVDFHSTDPAELAKLQKYNDRDSVFTWVLSSTFWSALSAEQRRAAVIEAECLPMVAQANCEGMLVDTLAARELAADLDKVAADMLAKLAPHGVTEKVVRSPIQLSKLMFDDWGLPVLKENTSKKTGKVSRSTDKEVLHELAFMDDRCADLRAYREALNNRAKFADAPLLAAEYNSDGRARPSAIVFGTYSGRLTYASKQGKNKDERQTGFALHQEKRGSQYRSIIIPPPGYTLMEFDASGQEFRWMAIASGDPTMLDLCQPGEDPHSYMGARIVGTEYQDLVRLVHEEDADAKDNRQLGKVANLCIAEGTQVLTDRGPCNIEHVRPDDRVWDGEQFVTHDGVSFSGVRQVITYQGVSGTPDHKVLVDGNWVELQEASRHGWVIEPALGAGRTSVYRAAFRIVGGLVGRAVHTLWRAICDGALRLRDREGSEPPVHGDRPLHAMQKLRDNRQTPSQRQVGRRYPGQKAAAEAGQRYAPTVHQPKGSLVSQLWRSWDRVPVRLYKRGCGVYSLGAAFGFLYRSGHRPDQQRRSLRAWKLALGYTSGELSEPRAVRTYDITNCGPYTRFAANGVIVHNSLQYRTSAPKLRSVARVQYNIPMELPEAQRIHKTYQNTYTLVPVYWRQQIAQTRQLGYVETFGGRRVQVVGNWDGDRGWSMGSTAINYRIQGTGAEQKYLAMAVIKSYLVSIGARFAWDLHDGIYLWVPDAKVAEAAVRIKALLDNLPYRQAWGFTPPIPLPWDCKVGKSWGALKEYKFD